MNLIKNVDGDPKVWKGKVRQDLDVIQRTINALIAQVNAIVIPTPTPPAVVSSANTVTTFDDDFLRSVATVPLSGLTGKGTITDPLGLSLTGAVSVDPAGALSGDGTAGSPLAVKVDGVSITIVGDQLVAAPSGGGQTVLEVQVTLSAAQLLTLNTIPVLVVGAPGVGQYVQVLWAKAHFHGDSTTPQEFIFSQNAQLSYGGTAYNTSAIMNFTAFSGQAHSQVDTWAEGTNPGSDYNTPNYPDNSAVYVRASIDNAFGLAGSGAMFVGLSIGYVILTAV